MGLLASTNTFPCFALFSSLFNALTSLWLCDVGNLREQRTLCTGGLTKSYCDGELKYVERSHEVGAPCGQLHLLQIFCYLSLCFDLGKQAIPGPVGHPFPARRILRHYCRKFLWLTRTHHHTHRQLTCFLLGSVIDL